MQCGGLDYWPFSLKHVCACKSTPIECVQTGKFKCAVHLVIPTLPFEKSIGSFRMTAQWSLIVSLNKEASCVYVQTNPPEVELSLFVSVKSRITQNKNMSNDHVGLQKGQLLRARACVKKGVNSIAAS